MFDLSANTPELAQESADEEISFILADQLEVLELSHKIQGRVRDSVEKNQREYFLQEQLKAIQSELGQKDLRTEELKQIGQNIAAAKMPQKVEQEALRELDRLSKIPPASPEYSVIRTYLDWVCELPWSIQTKDRLDINKAQRVLNTDHYDLLKVKKRILEFLAVRKLNPRGKSPILCFVGPPGVGKTSLGKSIARAMGRKFVRISLGGIRDEADIRGHRRTYIGALPGRILQELRKEVIKALNQKGDTSQTGSESGLGYETTPTVKTAYDKSTAVKDGMDMALLSIEKENKLCRFAGANNPLYLIRNNELIEIKGDKMPVAIYDRMEDFKSHEIQLESGDFLYMFSDGFADQFGGPNGKKFKYKPFKNLLLTNVDKSMKEQKNLLEYEIQNWMQHKSPDNGQAHEQVDDIVIIGIRI